MREETEVKNNIEWLKEKVQKCIDKLVPRKELPVMPKFVAEWLDGFTVEEEQKYYVYLGDGQYLVSEDELKEPYAKIRHEEDIGFSNYVLTFTEQEIKDYDERYMTFAKPIEEVEV